MRSRLVPEREFHSIADADLVVDDAEIIPNNMLAHAQLLRDFPVLETLGHQFNHMQLTRARSRVVLVNKYPSPHDSGGRASKLIGGGEGKVETLARGRVRH
jgi:hypothetical protein